MFWPHFLYDIWSIGPIVSGESPSESQEPSEYSVKLFTRFQAALVERGPRPRTMSAISCLIM